MSMLACHPAAAAQNIGRAVGFLQLRRIIQVSGVDGSPTAQIVRGYSINKNAPTGNAIGIRVGAAGPACVHPKVDITPTLGYRRARGILDDPRLKRLSADLRIRDHGAPISACNLRMPRRPRGRR